MPDYSVFNHEKLLDYMTKNKLTTPCYIYDTDLLDDTFAAANKALHNNFPNAMIHVALKIFSIRFFVRCLSKLSF